MSQHDFDITTFDANTGSTMRAAINAALQSLAGLSSGVTAPGTTYPFQLWMDTSTTPKTLKIRNSANTSWVVLGTVSDAGAVIFANAATAGGFTPSQTPVANQIPVLTSFRELAIGTKTMLAVQGSADTLNFYGGNDYAIIEGDSGTIISCNAYVDIDNNWHYRKNGAASVAILHPDASFTLQYAGSGTAGAVITWAGPYTYWHSGNDSVVPHTAESSLKIIRGTVASNGVISAGAGYTVTKNGTGDFTITFATPFTTVPSVTATTWSGYSAIIVSATTSTVRIQTGNPSSGSLGMGLYDAWFSFIAIGPR